MHPITDERPPSGWGFPGSARKAHYFHGDAESLCGRWWFTGRLEPDTGTASLDDCVACRRKFEALP